MTFETQDLPFLAQSRHFDAVDVGFGKHCRDDAFAGHEGSVSLGLVQAKLPPHKLHVLPPILP